MSDDKARPLMLLAALWVVEHRRPVEVGVTQDDTGLRFVFRGHTMLVWDDNTAVGFVHGAAESKLMSLYRDHGVPVESRPDTPEDGRYAKWFRPTEER